MIGGANTSSRTPLIDTCFDFSRFLLILEAEHAFLRLVHDGPAARLCPNWLMIEQLPNLVKSVGYKRAKHLSTDISSNMGLYNAENAMRNLRRRLYKETQENPLWMWPEGSSNWPAIQNHHEEKKKEFKNISLRLSRRLRIFTIIANFFQHGL